MVTIGSRVGTSVVTALLVVASLAFAVPPLAAQPGRPGGAGAAAGGATAIGAPAANGPGYQIVEVIHEFSIPPSSSQNNPSSENLGEKTITVLCPSGKLVLGGGYYRDPRGWNNKVLDVVGSGPTSTGNGWSVQISNGSTLVPVRGFIKLYAICDKKQ